MMKAFFSAVVLCLVSIYLNAAPAGWFTDPEQARAESLSRNLPVLIIFAGEECSDSNALRGKLDAFRNHIENKCVMLYIKLAPASRWSREFKQNLKQTYPFLPVESGIPLPAIYMTDSQFRDLEIKEPRYTASGFQKMVQAGQEKLAAAAQTDAAQVAAPAADEQEINKPSAKKQLQQTEKRRIQRRSDIEPEETSKKAEPSVAQQGKIYTAAMQQKEAERQRKNNRDPKGDPPAGWFTDPVKAKEYAASRNLPIMMLFSGTDWCGPCKGLRKRVLDKKDVQKLVVEKCVALYVHVPSGGWNMVRQKYPFWQSRGVPSFLFTDAEFNVIGGNVRDRSFNGISNAIKAATEKLK